MNLRILLCLCLLVLLGIECSEGPYFIPGSGTLPECDDAPAANLNGWWFDNGTVTIGTPGCLGADPGDEFTACALDWLFEQDGNDINIVVDEEYIINGRLCADQLYLEGGWWLPVMDEQGFCYEDDSAEEVGIMEAGNQLTVNTTEMTIAGVLAVQGGCSAEYDVELRPRPDR